MRTVRAEKYTPDQLVKVMKLTELPLWFEPLRALLLEYQSRQPEYVEGATNSDEVKTLELVDDGKDESRKMEKIVRVVSLVLVSAATTFVTIWILTLLGRLIVSALQWCTTKKAQKR